MVLVVPMAWAEDFYLEGVTTLGAKKSAYLSMKGGKITVREGESIGTWQVVRIERNAVVLSTGQGVTTELPLHTRFDIPSTINSKSPFSDGPTTEIDEEEVLPEGMTESPEDSQFTDLSMPSRHLTTTDSTIPAGYRKVHTPFGDVLVEEKEKSALTESLPEERDVEHKIHPKIADEAIPPGQRRVSTPFGDVLIKDKPPTMNAPE
ncbi:MAG: hypothetical protein BWK79_07805 [Beggiatoa sp. IS2]|nr:MAG: hypothetical protein BWK79_07805 [Beggiatoa sp. IS2]